MTRVPDIGTIDESKRRVLVVDDDRNFADGLRNLLALEGYEIGTAYGAGQAREIIETFEAQVAILDFRLGTTLGVDLIEPLTERRPGLVCILLTAYEDADTVVKALRSGAYDYVRKPVHADELLATLDRCFEKRRLVAAKEAAEEAKDNATSGIVDEWTDQAEERAWFLFEASRKG